MKNKSTVISLKTVISLMLLLAIMMNFALMANENWHSKDIEYYRVATKFDRIAKLEINKLLMLAPNLEGKLIAGLHLIHNGEKYPFYYQSSDATTNELIKKNDHIYFLGKQLKGDTTHFYDYSYEAVFYLYYNENESSEKLKKFAEPSHIQNEIQSVFVDLHLEKDNIYYLGHNILNYDTDRFEGWYWNVIRDFPGSTIGSEINVNLARVVENTAFFPTVDANEYVEISARFVTTASSGERQNIRRKVFTVVNADTVHRAIFDTLADNYIVTEKIAPHKLLAGGNSLQIINLTDDNTLARIGVDYFKIKGFSKPFAFNSNSVFEISNVAENSAIRISGFSDSVIVIHDTVTKSLLEKKGVPSVAIAANAKNSSTTENANPFISLKINNAIYVSERTGFHIGILRNGTPNAEFRSFENFNDSLNNLLQSLENNSFVAVAYNGTSEFPATVRNFLVQNGCSLFNNFSPAYTCAFKVGENKAAERYSNAYISQLDTTFFDEEKRNFSLEFNVAGDFANPFSYKFNISDMQGIENVEIEKTKKTDYRNTANSAEMIIIYHKEFEQKSYEYADYRTSQGYEIFLADVEEIYKEFGFGKKSPHSIKNFLHYAYQNWEKPAPQYVLLIGDASLDPRKTNAATNVTDYIPTYGNPASDYWYGLFDKDNSERKAEMIVGRIPASSNEHIENYFAKVKSYETMADATWHKKFLFVNGGITAQEKNQIRQQARFLGGNLYPAPFCGDTMMINKDLADMGASSVANRGEIISAINNGAMFTIFNGHGSAFAFDTWGWQVDNLNNRDKFGFLVTMSCNTGVFAETVAPPTRVNEDFILKSKDKGFVAALGATTTTTVGSNSELMQRLTMLLAAPNSNLRRIGDLLENAKQQMNYYNPSPYINVMRFCFGLLGDPLLAVRIDTIPDIFVNSNEIIVQSLTNEPVIREDDDEVRIIFPVHNLGIMDEMGFAVKLIHTYQNQQTEYSTHLHYLCRSENVFFTIPINGQAGDHLLTVIADPENRVAENNKTNNIATARFHIYSYGLLAVEPQSYWNMDTNNLLFRVINPLSKLSDFEYYFAIEQIVDGDTSLIKNSIASEITEFENYIDWTPTVELDFGKGNYLFSAWQKDLNTNLLGEKLIIPFNTYDNPFSSMINDDFVVAWRLRTKEELSSLKFENMVFENSDFADTNFIGLEDGFLYGTVTSPLIGPMKAGMYNLMIAGDFSDENSESKIIIYGLKNANSLPEKLFELDSLLGSFWGCGFTVAEHPYIQIEFSTTSQDNNSKHYVRSLEVNYVSAAELAMRAATGFAEHSVLRGDAAQFHLEIENISYRSNSTQPKINIDIIGESSGINIPFEFSLPDIPLNSVVDFQFGMMSDFFENSNAVTITADRENLGGELYLFNNSLARHLNVYEDTLAPHLEIAFDGGIISDGDFISDEPLIEVKLLDNSLLPVTVPQPIRVRMNGVALNETNTQLYELVTFANGDNLKATLKIIPHKITERVNYFSFIGVDAAGNERIEKYYLHISLSNFIRDLLVYPNPATVTDNHFNFSYYLVSAFSELEAELEIYNLLGLKVRTLRFPARMRSNIILWDMRDDAGNLINPGTYYYRLSIISDEQFGKIIFSR